MNGGADHFNLCLQPGNTPVGAATRSCPNGTGPGRKPAGLRETRSAATG
jgi:hypothetical protein